MHERNSYPGAAYLRLIVDNSRHLDAFRQFRHPPDCNSGKSTALRGTLNSRPPLWGDEVSLPPFADGIGFGADLASKLTRQSPKRDYLAEVLRHEHILGRDVLDGKSKLCRDQNPWAAAIWAMAVRPPRDFRDDFVKRTQTARERKNRTQEEVAVMLGIDQGTYKNYETLRPMPHHLVVPFCLAMDIEMDWLFGRPAKRAKKTPSRLSEAS